MNKNTISRLVITFLFLAFSTGQIFSAPITFQQGTGTFTQTVATSGDNSPAGSVDDPSSGGWAIGDFTGEFSTSAQIAVWETATNVNATQLVFQLSHLSAASQHNIGHFRLSVTSDLRTEFADGLGNGGDVIANWTELTNPIFSGTGGETFSVSNNRILVGGNNPTNTVYTVQYNGSFSNITGVRLEVLEDPSLATNGPGRAFNGNFVLTEFTLDATTTVPEPSTFLLLNLCLLVCYRLRRA